MKKMFASLVIVLGLGALTLTAGDGPNTNVPFMDDFEGYTNNTPLENGTNGWYSTSYEIEGTSVVSVVQQLVKYEGLQAAMIPVDTTLSNRFQDIAPTNIWIQMALRPSLYDGTNSPMVDTNAACMFYINSNGEFVVHNGPASPDPTNSVNWVVVTAAETKVPTNEPTWVQITLYENFAETNWMLLKDGVLVTNKIGFINPTQTVFTGFDIYNGGATSFIDNVNVMVDEDTPVSIVSEPQSRTNNVGTEATFAVVAAGLAPYFYQWQQDEVDIPTGTNAALVINPVTATDAGNYRCIVSNSINTVTSAVAVLSVNEPVAITGEPQSRTNNPGTVATFTVTATGTETIYYQWQQDEVDIPTGTNAALVINPVGPGDAGGYRCILSNMVNTVTSAVAVLSVNAPAVITLEPQSRTNNPGTIAVFTVAASGTPTLYYQWQKNQVDIPSANGTSYFIDPVTAGDAGNYRCIVSNMVNAATSAVAVLTVNAPVAIIAEPQSRTNAIGTEATFTVTATGTETIYYQWQKESVDIPYANSATYTIPTVGLAHAGNYRCILSNMVNTITSAVAVLTVPSPAGIVTHPQSRTNTVGTEASFTVVGSGTAPLYYQWQKESIDIGSATGATYTIVSVTTNDAGNFRCIVSNAYGSATSDVAVLTVNAPVAIVTDPQSRTNNVGTEAAFTVTATGTEPVYYQWQKEEVNIGSATGATYTIASVVAGDAGNYRCILSNMVNAVTSAVAELTVHSPVAITAEPQSRTNNPGTLATFTVTATGTETIYYQWQKGAADIAAATGATYTIAAVAAGDAGGYRCIVSNMVNTITSAVATLTVRTAPVITANPQPLTRNIGQSATFSVTATGSAPLYYRWQKNGANITGAAAANYTINQVTVGDAGAYRCVVSNAAGSATSASAALTVRSNLASVNDYDGDGKSDLAVYNSGRWSIFLMKLEVLLDNAGVWGGADWTAVPGDYDGDGKADLAVFRDGYWSVLSIARAGQGIVDVLCDNFGPWGGAGWTPISGDYDGDGKSDLAAYKDGFWTVYSLANGVILNNAGTWGGAGWVPVPGDYDGDGKHDLCVYNNGYWSIFSMKIQVLLDNAGVWGGAGWTPVPGDYDADGKSDLCVYNNGYWSIFSMKIQVLLDNAGVWGGAGWTPVSGDYDADGKSDLCVYNNGYWSIFLMKIQVLLDNAGVWGGAGWTPVK